eukprot:6195945-Pleurochrysis_carterae.AAC.4
MLGANASGRWARARSGTGVREAWHACGTPPAALQPSSRRAAPTACMLCFRCERYIAGAEVDVAIIWIKP